VSYAFGQKKFVRPEMARVGETNAGWMHFFVFWGFVVLALQIITMFGRGYSAHFHVPLIGGGPYLVLRDEMEAIVFFWVGMALVRWLITDPPRLRGCLPGESRCARSRTGRPHVILGLIATIMVTGLVYDGSRAATRAALDPEVAREAAWAPLSRLWSARPSRPPAIIVPLATHRVRSEHGQNTDHLSQGTAAPNADAAATAWFPGWAAQGSNLRPAD